MHKSEIIKYSLIFSLILLVIFYIAEGTMAFIGDTTSSTAGSITEKIMSRVEDEVKEKLVEESEVYYDNLLNNIFEKNPAGLSTNELLGIASEQKSTFGENLADLQKAATLVEKIKTFAEMTATQTSILERSNIQKQKNIVVQKGSNMYNQMFNKGKLLINR